MVRRPKSWRPAVLVVVMLLLLAGLAWGLVSALAASSAPSPPPSNGKVTLRVGWLADPDNLNPFIGTTSSAYMVWDLNYDSVVNLNSADLTPSKDIGLASDWTSTPDGKTWTFTIRPNVKWQDGQPVTASDIAFTINLVVDHQNATWISYLSTVKHATAVDPTHVRVDCKKPVPTMLLDLVALPILPEHIWSKIPYKTAANTFPNKPPIIGSGPFECTVWKKSDYLVMEANKDYWRGPPKIDEIVFMTYTNADTMGQEMKEGSLDACDGLLDAQMKMLKNTSGITSRAVLVNGYDELGFNCYTGGPSGGNPVLKDYRFRQALQWAVDKNKLCQIGYGGLVTPADTVVTAGYYHNPDWHWTPPADQAYTFDLDKANAALDAAGYTDTNGDGTRDYKGKPIELRLWARSSYPQSVTCGKLMTGWFRKLGLKIDFTTVDDGALEDALYKSVNGKFDPDYDMFEWGWYNDIDAGMGLDYFTTSQIDNWSDCAWSYPPFDALYKQQSVEMDQAKRLDDVYKLQQMVYEQSPYIPLAFSDDTEAWNTAKWTGWVTTPEPSGNVVFPPYGFGSYLTVAPNTGAKTSQAGSTGVLIAIIVAVVVVLAVIVFLVVRKKRPPESAEV